MKKISTLIFSCLLGVYAGISAQVEGVLQAEKTYPNNTRIAYFELTNPLSYGQKALVMEEYSKTPKLIRLEFFDNSQAMFESSIDFTFDSVLNVISNVLAEYVPAQRAPSSSQTSPCDNIIALQCGVEVSSTLGTTGEWTTYTASTYTCEGEEKVYSFTPTQNGSYTFKGTTVSGTPRFFIMSDCDNNSTNLKNGNWNGGSTALPLTANVPVYFIVDNRYSTSNASYKIIVTCPPPPDPTCMTAQPGCASTVEGITYPAATNVASLGTIGCLSTTPNAAWYWMQISIPGDLQIHIASGGDVDFICWGPFSSKEEACSAKQNLSCSNNHAHTLPYPYGNIVDCCYCTSATENLHINNAQAGDVYMLLITNYYSQQTNINFAQTGGTGSTDCSIVTTPPVRNNGPICEGGTLNLTSNYVAGAIYQWNGPNGWTSNVQNPTIPNVTPANAGQYSLRITANGTVGNLENTNVVIYPKTYSEFTETICRGGKYFYNNRWETAQGDYLDTLRNSHQCDSIVTLHLVIDSCYVNLSDITEICADDPAFDVQYEIVGGDLTAVSARFSQQTIGAGFADFNIQNPSSNIISIDIPQVVRPNHYNVDFVFDYADYSQITEHLPFTILYSDTIIEQRWNDVLALLNDRHNGGYTFSAYEWYRNGEKILKPDKKDEYEIGSYYYAGDGSTLDFTAQYRALLTRADDGVLLFTCVPDIAYRTNFADMPSVFDTGGTARIQAKNGGTLTIMSVSGITISRQNLTAGENIINAPQQAGFYIMVINTQNEMPVKQVIVVK